MLSPPLGRSEDHGVAAGWAAVARYLWLIIRSTPASGVVARLDQVSGLDSLITFPYHCAPSSRA